MLVGDLFSRTHIFVDGGQFSTFNLHVFYISYTFFDHIYGSCNLYYHSHL